MGWVTVKPLPHTCSMPPARHLGAGSIWQCDHCQIKWRWTGFYFEDPTLKLDEVEHDYIEKQPSRRWWRF